MPSRCILLTLTALIAGCARGGFDPLLDAMLPADARGRDGGPRDAPPDSAGETSPQDSGGPDRAVACPAPAGALFHTSFEAGETAAYTLEANSEGYLTGVNNDARCGSRSLRASVPDHGDGTSAHILVTLAPPAVANDLFIRAFVQLSAGAAQPEWIIVFMPFATPDPHKKVSFDILSGDRLGLANNVQRQPAGVSAAPGSMPRGRWVCLELQVTLSDTAGRLRLFADDALALESAPDQDTLPGQIDQVAVGLVDVTKSGPVELLLDDVVISTSRVGCQ